MHHTILNINIPTKTRDFSVLLYIKVILIHKEMVMKLTDQDIHQMFIGRFLYLSDVKSLFKIAIVAVLALLVEI